VRLVVLLFIAFAVPLLFFGSARPPAPGEPAGDFDIYVSEQVAPGSFGVPTRVGSLSDDTFSDQRPSVRFDGLEVFFFSNRAGSVGADLWTSTRATIFDDWSAPVNLGTPVNSAFTDFQPYIVSDRRTLYFVSDRSGNSDLYVTTRTKVAPGQQ
jgi:hypothetical protein